jgi:three-Cys-motif partner protein
MKHLVGLGFGHYWTEQKLAAVDKYMDAYLEALKNKGFKHCYIDAFAGNGHVKLKSGVTVEGSTIRALKKNFDRYYFLEINKENAAELQRKVDRDYPEKAGKVTIIASDCNAALTGVCGELLQSRGWRGVAFLDPYAMDLLWQTIAILAGTTILDVWYFFPMMAVSRNMPRKFQRIQSANHEKVAAILGDPDWQKRIYREPDQLSLFEGEADKADTEGIRQYVLDRLKETFPVVSEKACIMRNEKNAPVFLLCFAASTKSPAGQRLAINIADYILEHIED